MVYFTHMDGSFLSHTIRETGVFTYMADVYGKSRYIKHGSYGIGISAEILLASSNKNPQLHRMGLQP